MDSSHVGPIRSPLALSIGSICRHCAFLQFVCGRGRGDLTVRSRSRSFPKKSDERALSAGREILAGGCGVALAPAGMANRNRIPQSSPISPGQRLGRRVLLLSLGPTKAFRHQRLSVAGSGCCIRVRTWYVRDEPPGVEPAEKMLEGSSTTSWKSVCLDGQARKCARNRHEKPSESNTAQGATGILTRSEVLRANGMVYPPERRTNPIGRAMEAAEEAGGGQSEGVAALAGEGEGRASHGG